MQIISTKVEWHEEYLNFPNLVIEVDALPDPKVLRYEERNGIYYAEHRGYVSFFYYTAPGDGFGGAKFPIVMKDGTSKVLVGPWSSRASCVNEQGFGPCMDVTLKVQGKPHSYFAGAVTLHLAQRAVKGLPGVFLIPFTRSGEVTFTPSLEAGRIVKPSRPHGGGPLTRQMYDDKGMLVDIK